HALAWIQKSAQVGSVVPLGDANNCGLAAKFDIEQRTARCRHDGGQGARTWLSLVTASLFGLCVPSLLQHFKLDPKIAAGPVTLALADFFALVFYFTSALAGLNRRFELATNCLDCSDSNAMTVSIRHDLCLRVCALQ